MPELLYAFLDANVIFSASYKAESHFLEFWNTPNLVALTSRYVAQEVRRNCRHPEHAHRLEALLEQTLLVSDPLHDRLPAGISLPVKDRPILSSAIDAGASFLITGDKNHFGQWMNRPIKVRYGNLIIMEPRPFLTLLKTIR